MTERALDIYSGLAGITTALVTLAVAAVVGLFFGFANPLIYSLARGRGNVYYDVTPQGDQGNIRSDFNNGLNASAGLHYSVRTFNQDSSLTTGKGWDDVTGVGAVTARYIAAVSGHQ